MKKRLLSTLLAVCMVLSLLPGAAWAAEDAEDEPAPPSAAETQPDSLTVLPGEDAKESDGKPFADGLISADDIMPLADTLTYGNLFYVVEDGAIKITECDTDATNVSVKHDGE